MKYEPTEGGTWLVEEDHQDLRSRTKAFALRIINLFGSLPNKPSEQILGKQLLRSGTSVGANYREAFRARSDAEFIAKIGDCLKELDETSYWLELLDESALIPHERLANLLDETNQLLAIFTTISKKVKSRIKG